MNFQANESRLLSADECDGVAGGWVHYAVLAAPFIGAAIMGIGTYFGTQPDTPLVPTIDFPGSPEEPGMKVRGTSRGGRPA
jgi:hypothetical protein